MNYRSLLSSNVTGSLLLSLPTIYSRASWFTVLNEAGTVEFTDGLQLCVVVYCLVDDTVDLLLSLPMIYCSVSWFTV